MSRWPRLLLIALVAALSLHPLSAQSAPGSAPSPLVPPVPLATADYYRINASAHGLAGLGAHTNLGSGSWETTPQWLAYQSWINERWGYLQRVRLGGMHAFATAHLATFQGANVFYPFSGPDFLYADTFFPNAPCLVMAGLEPVGSVPDLGALQQQGRLDAYLQDVESSLATSLAASFFKTKDMKTDFNPQLVDGVLPDIAVFLAHAGCAVDSLQYVTLGHDGMLHPHGPAGATGVQISFFQGNRSSSRTLLYFQANLAADGLKANPGFVHLLHRLGPGVTYLKAASYLLHEDEFSTVREVLLRESFGVVEDDSGIPLRDFPSATWDVEGFGKYTGPLEIFKKYDQPDLAKFFAANSFPPLAFGSGYKYVAGESSLLVAKRRSSYF